MMNKNIVAKSIITEMKDWKTHFLNGTKGMPKTDERILKGVEKFLSKEYPDNEEKVNNNPLAPWLVMTFINIKPENLTPDDFVKMRSVVDYYKATGNASFVKANRRPDATFDVTPLSDASNYAVEKLNKLKTKVAAKPVEKVEKPVEQPIAAPQEQIPPIKAEQNGDVERVWISNDGSGRMWVKVINMDWLTKICDDKIRTWGVKCQATATGVKFRTNEYINYQFIGPKKGTKENYATILAIAVFKANGLMTELKQEGNQQPGSQKTSGGWEDADEQTVYFLSNSPEAKSTIKGFADYSGEIPNEVTNDQNYGASMFLKYLKEKRPELLNYLADARPDIVDVNYAVLKSLMGEKWFDERNLDISEIAERNPLDFLQRFELYLKRFGKEAIRILNNLNLEEIAKSNSKLIYDIIGSLIGNIPVERFNNLIKNINFSNYIVQHTEGFKLLIKNMANLPEYKNMFKNLVFEHSLDIIKAFGDKNIGIKKFLEFAATPKKREHANAVYDKSTGQYIGEKRVIVNPDAPIQNRIYKMVKYVVTDDLKILNQKERRKFIEQNEAYIKSFYKDEVSKEIGYLQYLFSESNPQEVQKTMVAEKDKFVNFYDLKFKNKEIKKVKLADGTIIEEAYMPGIMEYYKTINKNKPGNVKRADINDYKAFVSSNRINWINFQQASTDKSIVSDIFYYKMTNEDAKKYIQTIIKYYYNRRYQLEKEKRNKNYAGQNSSIDDLKEKYLAIKDYMHTLYLSLEDKEGDVTSAKENELLDFYINTFKPEALKAPPSIGAPFFINNIKEIFDRKKAFEAINKLHPYLKSIGAENVYIISMNNLKVRIYNVKIGDLVMYNIPDDSNNFTYKKLYKVLGTRNTSETINGEILVSDEGRAAEVGRPEEMPVDKWVSSDEFDIKYKKDFPPEIVENINENLIRNKIRERIAVISENIKKKRPEFLTQE